MSASGVVAFLPYLLLYTEIKKATRVYRLNPQKVVDYKVGSTAGTALLRLPPWGSVPWAVDQSPSCFELYPHTTEDSHVPRRCCCQQLAPPTHDQFTVVPRMFCRSRLSLSFSGERRQGCTRCNNTSASKSDPPFTGKCLKL